MQVNKVADKAAFRAACCRCTRASGPIGPDIMEDVLAQVK